MDNRTPLVSVITPTHNGEKYLSRVIESVRRQNYPLEHIIVDDCSSDGSWEILMNLCKAYPWITPLRLSQNSGPLVARNEGIRRARGRFLAFLDVDDLWLPMKLSTQVDFMLRADCGFSFTDYRFINLSGTKIGRIVKGRDIINRETHFSTREGLGCLTVMIDIQRHPGFKFTEDDASSISKAEDFVAWANLLRSTDAIRVPHDLARYSVVPGSRSANFVEKALVIWDIYRHREGLPLLRALPIFLSFLVSASRKRIMCRPKESLRNVDGWIGEDWINLVRLS